METRGRVVTVYGWNLLELILGLLLRRKGRWWAVQAEVGLECLLKACSIYWW